jgi:hypothetical protein
MSKLLAHAEAELKRAGLHEKDSDYGGMIYDSVMRLMRAFTGQGHSGGSAGQTLAIFNRVANWENLEPLTSDPAEWDDVSELGGGIGQKLWQNQRNPAFFSKDHGKTWFNVNEGGFGKVNLGGPDETQHRTEGSNGETSGSVPGN